MSDFKSANAEILIEVLNKMRTGRKIEPNGQSTSPICDHENLGQYAV